MAKHKNPDLRYIIDNYRGLITYGGNLALGPITGLLHGSNTSNTLGALVFGGAYLIENHLPKLAARIDSSIKNLGITNGYSYLRLFRAAGALYYGLSTIGGLINVLSGNFDRLWHTVPDALMAYQLTTETMQAYPNLADGVKRDLLGVKTSLESIAKKQGWR